MRARSWAAGDVRLADVEAQAVSAPDVTLPRTHGARHERRLKPWKSPAPLPGPQEATTPVVELLVRERGNTRVSPRQRTLVLGPLKRQRRREPLDGQG